MSLEIQPRCPHGIESGRYIYFPNPDRFLTFLLLLLLHFTEKYLCIFSITISWEQTHIVLNTLTHVFSVCVCVCVSCDDIVKPCSLRRSQESDLQMRSSWTSKMKYSSVLIRGRTLTEHSNL